MGGGGTHDASVIRMQRDFNNRAATAMFRAFGPATPPLRGDSSFVVGRAGMHRGEWLLLAIAVPLGLAVAWADLLARWNGCAALLGTLPALWLSLNVLPFVFRTSKPQGQWLCWGGLLAAWSIWRCQHGGAAAIAAWAWLAVVAIELLGWLTLGWLRTMRWSGNAGIAWRVAWMIGLHALAVVVGWRCGLPWGLAAGAVVAAGFCLTVLRPKSQLLGRMITRCDAQEVLITIDDGPDPHDTPLLLDALDRHGVRAVFFVIGSKAEAHPELVREIVRRGHELGNHTQTHPQGTFWCAGPARTRREIVECQRRIEAITGVAPRWFRAPVGHRNLFTHPVCGELGLEVMAWRRRGYDAVCGDAGKVLAKLLDDIAAGDIVLMHEATPIALQVLEGVLAGLQERGLKASALTQSGDC